MGFSSVYRVLQEVFPQVDSRMLKAVAIEHSKDPDTAVEVVLVEVLPNLPKQSPVVSSVNRSISSPSHSEDRGKAVQFEATVNSADVITRFHEQSSAAGPSNSYGSLTALNGGSSSPILDDSSFYDANDETEGVPYDVPVLSEKFVDNSSINFEGASINERSSYDYNGQGFVKTGGENVSSIDDSAVSGAAVSGSFHKDDTLPLDVSASAANYNNYIHLDVGTLKLDASATSLKDDDYVRMDVDTKITIPPVINCETPLAVTQESDASSSKTTSEDDDAFEVESVNSEHESNMTSMLTSSIQNCSTELLEEIIEDARNNKDALVSAMNSIVDLTKDVESKEKAAEEVKEEANRSCSDIFAKVDELKQALRRAKEANDMHAGEVHAEKAILATELKELQFRLFTLSDERNKSLEILEEMRKALEIRLAAALEEIKAAEEGKLEKAKLAREALLFQENQMEKVVEESKKLKLEAEENSKLQEYLMDRGRAIDILQGEFSVKFQDVLLLKEKFDRRIPLSRSLSSSEKSSILASSNSSFRSISYRLEHEQERYETPRKGPELDDSYGFLEKSTYSEEAYSPKSPTETTYPIADRSPSGDEKQIKDRKALIDAEWELFDNEDFIIRN